VDGRWLKQAWVVLELFYVKVITSVLDAKLCLFYMNEFILSLCLNVC